MFERFVKDFGGEVLLEVNSVRYADFLFQSDKIVTEFKTLEEDKTLDHAKKIHDLAHDWRRRGLLYAFGTVTLSLPELPKQCQDEWLDILKPPVENVIRDANRQIRSTKEYLRQVTQQPVFEISKDAFSELGLTRVRVEITSRLEGDQHIVTAQVFCQKDNCERPIELVSDGPNTRQWVECPFHGMIASFENLAEYEKTMRSVVIKTTAERGLQGIDPDAEGRVI